MRGGEGVIKSWSSHGGASKEVDKELDGGRFCVRTTGHKAREARDDDPSLECADEETEGERRKKVEAEHLD